MTVLLLVCLLAALLAGCGYTWRGQKGALSENSVLGTGNKTLLLKEVDHTTLYPWLTYAIRSHVRDDINARNMAVWVDSGKADFTLTVRVPSFKIRSYGSYRSNTNLYTATIVMEFVVFDGVTNTQVWTSGPIEYSDTFEDSSEEEALREVVSMTIRRCMERLQQRF